MPHVMATESDAVIFDEDTRPSALLDLTKQDLFAEADLPAIIDAIDFHGGRLCTATNKVGCLGNISVRGDCLPPTPTEPSPAEDELLLPITALNLEDLASTASSSLQSPTTSPSLSPSSRTRTTVPNPASSHRHRKPAPSPASSYIEAVIRHSATTSSSSSFSSTYSTSSTASLLPLAENMELHWLRQISHARRSFAKAERLITVATRINAQAVQALQRATEMQEVAEFALADCRRGGVGKGKGKEREVAEKPVKETKVAGNSEVREVVGGGLGDTLGHFSEGRG